MMLFTLPAESSEKSDSERRAEVLAAAEAAGLKVRQISGLLLFSVEGTWCSVTLSGNHGEDVWLLRRTCRTGSGRRTKTIYKGESLEKAMAEAREWLATVP